MLGPSRTIWTWVGMTWTISGSPLFLRTVSTLSCLFLPAKSLQVGSAVSRPWPPLQGRVHRKHSATPDPMMGCNKSIFRASLGRHWIFLVPRWVWDSERLRQASLRQETFSVPTCSRWEGPQRIAYFLGFTWRWLPHSSYTWLCKFVWDFYCSLTSYLWI